MSDHDDCNSALARGTGSRGDIQIAGEHLRKVIAQRAARMPEVQPRAHKVPCKHCPSAHYPPDPESADIAQWPHAARLETAFACGWNGKRYCKGYCDQMGISDADLQGRNASAPVVPVMAGTVGDSNA